MNNWRKHIEQGLGFAVHMWRKNKLLLLLSTLILCVLMADRLAPVSLTPKLKSQVVVASNGLPLRKFADQQGVWRYPRKLSEVSLEYIHILLNYEDKYFYQHFGVNPFSLVRAAWQWTKTGRVISGGSTITMQVARLVRPTKRTVWGKAIQILTALQLEWRFSKAEILTYYINHAPFGGRIEGVEAASMFYFGHSAQDLTYAQAALLAVLPQSPSRNRPDRYPLVAEKARNKVLQRMRSYDLITEQDYQEHLLERVEVPDEKMPVLAPLLSRRLAKQSDQEVIETTLDYDKQQAAEEIVKSYVQGLGDKVSGAVLVIDNETGEVLVYIGSADFYDNSRFAHIDMVRAGRSPGSTLKPFIYGMALDEGIIHSQSLLLDVPLKFEDYIPENFNDRFSGPVSATAALSSSLNVPAVQLLEQVTPTLFFSKMLNAGVQLQLPRFAKPNLAIALGGLSTNLENLVRGYSALASEGITKDLVYVTSSTQINESNKLPVLSASAAWVVSDMLRAKSKNRYINQLSKRGYSIKTGTSAGHTDVWALATNPSYTIGVWLGRPDNGAMSGHQGSDTAVPLLYQLTGILPRSKTRAEKPDEVSKQLVCWPTGRAATQDCLQSHQAWTINQNTPLTLMSTKAQSASVNLNEIEVVTSLDTGLRLSSGCNIRSTTRRVALWPEQLERWLPTEWKNETRIPKLDPRCVKPDTLNQMRSIEIVGVKQGQIFQRIEGKAIPDLTLTALNPSGTYYWYVNGKLDETESKSLKMQLTPGFYQVTLLDQLGKVDKVSFTVN